MECGRWGAWHGRGVGICPKAQRGICYVASSRLSAAVSSSRLAYRLAVRLHAIRALSDAKRDESVADNVLTLAVSVQGSILVPDTRCISSDESICGPECALLSAASDGIVHAMGIYHTVVVLVWVAG